MTDTATDSWRAWVRTKDCRVFAVAIQLIQEVGFASVHSVRARLDQIGMPLIDRSRGWDDHDAQGVRNCLDRLNRHGYLDAVKHPTGQMRWVDPDG